MPRGERRGWVRAGPSRLGPLTPLSAVDSTLSTLSRQLLLDVDIKSNRKSFLSRGITGFHGSRRCRNAGRACLGFVFFPQKTKQNNGRVHRTHRAEN